MPSSTSTAAKAQFNFRASTELLNKLDAYAEMVGQPRASIAAQALEDYLDWRIPQIADLKEAIASMDRGEFASDDEVEAVFKKYGA
jgi:predicted transcriptional regulator